MERLDLTPLDTPEPDLTYLFKHVITQQVVYDLLLFSQRKDIHAAIARWYEQAHAGSLASFYPLLAHHWERAGDDCNAVKYLSRAGETSLAGGAFKEAVEFFRRALEMQLPNSGPSAADRLCRARWELALGRAFNGLGEIERALHHGERSYALYGIPIPAGNSALAFGIARELVVQALHRLCPHQFVGHLPLDEARIPKTNEGSFLAEVYSLRDQPRYLFFALMNLNLIEARGREDQAAVHALVAVVSLMVGLPSIAAKYRRLAEEEITCMAQSADLAKVRFLLGCFHVMNGELASAVNEMSSAVDLANASGDKRFAGYGAGVLAGFLTYRGSFGAALEISDRWESVSRAEGWDFVRSIILRVAAFANLMTGTKGTCFYGLERDGIMAPSDAENQHSKLMMAGMQSLGFHREGRGAEAREAARRALDCLVQARGWSFIDYMGLGPVAEAILASWQEATDPQEARFWAKEVSRLISALRSFSRTNRIGEPLYYRVKGRSLALRGHPGLAGTAYKKGLAAATRMGMAHEERLLRELIATS